jgi:anti-sigma factor RsiW
MTCREASNLLPLFFDGELDSHQMRAVALHSTRCDGCEGKLRQLERLHDLVTEHVSAVIEEIDAVPLWNAIEQHIGNVTPPWWLRARAWWNDSEHPWVMGIPAFAAAAVIAVLAFVFLTRAPQPSTEPAAPQVAAVDTGATIDSLDTDVDSVAVLNDPETRTTVLWVSDDGLMP